MVKNLKMIEIQSISQEYSLFMSSYILPFLGFDLQNERMVAVVIIFLIILGIISVKTDLYFKNPILAIFGFKIYKAKLENKEYIYIISKDTMKQNQECNGNQISDSLYFVRRNKNASKN